MYVIFIIVKRTTTETNKTSCKSPYNFKKEYAYFGDWYVYFFLRG